MKRVWLSSRSYERNKKQGLRATFYLQVLSWVLSWARGRWRFWRFSKFLSLLEYFRSFHHFSKFLPFFEVLTEVNEYDFEVFTISQSFHHFSKFSSFFEVLPFSDLAVLSQLGPHALTRALVKLNRFGRYKQHYRRKSTQSFQHFSNGSRIFRSPLARPVRQDLR